MTGADVIIMRPLRRSRTHLPAAIGLLAAALAAGAGVGHARAAEPVPGVMVRFDADATAADRRAVAADLDAADAGRPLLAGWRLYRLRQPVDLTALDADVSGDAGVRDVALDGVGMPATADPLYPEQWYLRNTGQVLGFPATAGTPGADISYEAAVRRVPSRAPVTVAVVDTGVELTHPELSRQLWTNPGEVAGNGIDDDRNGYVDDVHGWNVPGGDGNPAAGATAHGTQVAGTIAAATDNGRGIAGVASNARIMAVKIGETGAAFPWSQVIAGLAYVRRFPEARVVNMSLGGAYSQPLCDAIAQLTAEGRIVVVAAGNTNADLTSTPYSPATCTAPTMVAVGASTHTDARAGFSNYSTTHVDLFAPGYFMYWESADRSTSATANGTSFAAPLVSGAAAFVLGTDPSLSAAGFRAAVMAGGDRMDPPGAPVTSVSGNRLDMAGLLDRLGIGMPDTTPPGTTSPTAPAAGAWTTARPVLSWAAAADDVGVTGYDVLVDGAVVARTSALTWTPAAPLAEGDHTWGVRARDAAGNTGAASSRTLRVDTVPPAAVTLESPAARAVVAPGPVRFSWSGGSDANAVRYRVSVGGATATDTTATEAVVSVDTGSADWSVAAVDAAGNVRSSEVRPLVVAAPAVAPPIPAQEVPAPDAPAPPAGPPPAPDPASGLPVSAPSAPAPAPVPAPAPATPVPATPGPGAVRINGGAAWTTRPDVTVSIDAPAGADRMRVSTPGTDAGWVPVSPVARIRLRGGVGARTVTVAFRPAAGTAGAVEAADTIGLDTSPPAVLRTVVRPAPGGAVRIAVRAGDAGSGLARLRVGVTGASRTVALSGSVASASVTLPRTGTAYSVSLTDGAGNVVSRRLEPAAR